MEENTKLIDMVTAWAQQEMQAVNVAIIIVAYYNKLIAEGLEEFMAFKLTKMFAKALYRELWK